MSVECGLGICAWCKRIRLEIALEGTRWKDYPLDICVRCMREQGALGPDDYCPCCQGVSHLRHPECCDCDKPQCQCTHESIKQWAEENGL